MHSFIHACMHSCIHALMHSSNNSIHVCNVEVFFQIYVDHSNTHETMCESSRPLSAWKKPVPTSQFGIFTCQLQMPVVSVFDFRSYLFFDLVLFSGKLKHRDVGLVQCGVFSVVSLGSCAPCCQNYCLRGVVSIWHVSHCNE